MKIILLIVIVMAMFAYSKPMESIEHYNIILVHGAADSLSGVDCEASDLKTPFEYYVDSTGDFKRIQGYVKEGMFWWSEDSRSTATGMMKTLPNWINDKILDGQAQDLFGIYLNRPFVNPANTPIVNGREIGNRTWKGRDNCKVRRSLTEEAEEIRLRGRKKLISDRNNPLNYRNYTQIDSIGYHTHRNILIAHSMGGLASREYVQGDDYNRDVDKVITLDSPHRGTYSLNGLLDMKRYISSTSIEALSQMTLLYGTGLILDYGGFTVNQTALLAITYGFVGLDALNAFVDALVDLALQYGFKEDDPLTKYIVPGSAELAALNGKKWNETMPLFRVLYGVGGLTFGSNEEYLQNFGSFFVPDGLLAMVKNIIAQASHTELDGAAYANNIIAGGTLGFVGGLGLTDQGSILIPHWSGAGEGVSVFENGNPDFVRVSFSANEHTNQGNKDTNIMGIVAASNAALIACEALNVFSPAAVKVAKTAIGITTGVVLAFLIVPPTVEAVLDMTENHKNPSQSDWQEKQKSKKNTYMRIDGKNEDIETYLLEDLLYEKPFVNLSVRNANDWTEIVDSTKMDSLGLYGVKGSLAVKDMKLVRFSPLKFNTSSDWGKFGVKTERWERVDGLDEYGMLAKNSVPVRHVERYEAPAITVDDWIEKYSFVVDDLMPHRLRQIRMNFNYQEEIAWECDVTKDYSASDNCTVYKRTSGGEWTELRKEKHPVRKDGAFDFKPRDYGYDNLLSLQKDNQNTVTVSTVNKIGLSNTQRFHYLFKAADDLLVPVWPKRDVVVNKVSGFEAYASVLDYQGFSVEGMRDSLWRLSGDSVVPLSGLRGMGFLRSEGSGNVYGSRISQGGLSEGEYHWVFNAVTRNSAGESNDSNDVYDVPFHVDVTPPNFELSVDGQCMNPDSSVFVARFAWGDSSTPDIRAMRWQLEKNNGSGFSLVTAMPSLHDVTSKDFAVAWDKVPDRESLQDGLYRVKALAIDYAAPNLEAHGFATGLVAKIAGGTDKETDWNRLGGFEFNRTEKTIEFCVDRTAPELNFERVGGAPPDSFGVEKYAGLSRPSRNPDFEYVSGDSLLQVEYSVKEPLGGRDSAAVTVAWMFVHAGDTAKIDRAGDSVWVKGSGGVGRGA